MMPDDPPKPPREAVQADLAKAVQRALVQAADLRDVEDKMDALVAKSARLTPVPEVPPEQDATAQPTADEEEKPPGLTS